MLTLIVYLTFRSVITDQSFELLCWEQKCSNNNYRILTNLLFKYNNTRTAMLGEEMQQQ